MYEHDNIITIKLWHLGWTWQHNYHQAWHYTFASSIIYQFTPFIHDDKCKFCDKHRWGEECKQFSICSSQNWNCPISHKIPTFLLLYRACFPRLGITALESKGGHSHQHKYCIHHAQLCTVYYTNVVKSSAVMRPRVRAVIPTYSEPGYNDDWVSSSWKENMILILNNQLALIFFISLVSLRHILINSVINCLHYTKHDHGDEYWKPIVKII